MFIVKHRIQTRDGDLVLEELLALGAASREECDPLMEGQAKSYDHHGYDGENDRWWGWNATSRGEVHYWRAIPLVPDRRA